MADATATADKATEKAGGFLGKIGDFFGKIGDLVKSTNIPQQINDVDFTGLFTNPWFIIPFVGYVGWQIYRQSFRELLIVLLIVGVWYLSGTPYMQTLIVDGELQIGKILPVLFGGAAVLGVIIYMIFSK